MTQTPAEDIEGQLSAIIDAIGAMGQLLPQEQRNQFHMNLQRMNPPTQSPGYAWARGQIIRLTR